MDMAGLMEKLQDDAQLATRFAREPAAVLKELDVDATGLLASTAETPPEALDINLCPRVCVKVGLPLLGCPEIGKNVGP